MNPKKEFRPQHLRTVLAFIFVIVLIGGIGLFYVGLGMVKEYSAEVNQRLVDAEASGKQVDELQMLKNQLSQSDSLIKKANQLFATPNSYRAQVLSDVENYATAADLSINRIAFKEGSEHTVTVTLSSPVSYKSLITFLNNIETNLPKLQVSALSLQTVDATDVDSVGVGNIEIDVLVR